ncbi:MAG: hypothetical protein NTX97_14725 [Bacteroidetes bacterium]|nr:hypothetical protein [Bacteroidota bacterium]
MKLPEILKKFGTPLSQLPNSNGSTPMSKGKVILLIAVTGLAIYGGVTLYNKIKEHNDKKKQ